MPTTHVNSTSETQMACEWWVGTSLVIIYTIPIYICIYIIHSDFVQLNIRCSHVCTASTSTTQLNMPTPQHADYIHTYSYSTCQLNIMKRKWREWCVVVESRRWTTLKYTVNWSNSTCRLNVMKRKWRELRAGNESRRWTTLRHTEIWSNSTSRLTMMKRKWREWWVGSSPVVGEHYKIQ